MDQIYDQHTRAGQAAAAAFEQGLAGPDEEELAAELRRGARSFVAIAEDWLASPSFDEGLLEAYRGAQRGGGTHDRNIDPAVLLETILGVYAELPEGARAHRSRPSLGDPSRSRKRALDHFPWH